MKVANTKIFQRLVEFAETREFTIPNRNAPRWVHANPEVDARLIRSTIAGSISFGRYRHLAWVEFDDKHYIASIGFEHAVRDPNLVQLEDSQGFDVCLLSELPVFPSASAAEVYNVVAAGNKSDDPKYRGHDNEKIMGLFPIFSAYQCVTRMDEGTIWPAFLSICAEETQHGGSWIEQELADSLAELAQDPITSFPYRELCRSSLDLDPRSLFMSLYRCIEATYAHEKATKLKTALSVEHSWSKIAAILESEMSWRPLESESLNNVLKYAHNDDLQEICACLKKDPGENTSAAAGNAIYRLRNRIVHYRPTTDPFDFDSLDWNRTCNVLVSIARDVFHRAYNDDAIATGTN